MNVLNRDVMGVLMLAAFFVLFIASLLLFVSEKILLGIVVMIVADFIGMASFEVGGRS